MKKTLLTSAVMAIVALPSVGQSIELTDYMFADSQYQDAYITGTFGSQAGNQDQTSYDYLVNAFYNATYSTLPRVWNLNLDATADGTRGSNDGDKLDDKTKARAAGQVDNYFQDTSKWFWLGEAEVLYDSEQSEINNAYDDPSDIKATVGAGIGYGRIYNATPLAKIIRVIEELQESGVVIADVPNKTYIDLAQVVDRQTEFISKYGEREYRTQWYAAIEEIMSRDGIIKEGKLGAGGGAQMQRVLDSKNLGTAFAGDQAPIQKDAYRLTSNYDTEYIGIREHGWKVQASVGDVIQDFTGETNDPYLSAKWIYAKPFALTGQFRNEMEYQTIFRSDTTQKISNDMSYLYEISDRLDWINSWLFSYEWGFDQADIGGNDDIMENTLSTGLDYYLTNNLTAGVLVSLHRVVDDNVTNNNEDNEINTRFNIRYRFK